MTYEGLFFSLRICSGYPVLKSWGYAGAADKSAGGIAHDGRSRHPQLRHLRRKVL